MPIASGQGARDLAMPSSRAETIAPSRQKWRWISNQDVPTLQYLLAHPHPTQEDS
jgi:hypothetical protein